MIHFTEDMRIGIPHIDTQHESLVDFANKAVSLCDAKPEKEEMKEVLEFLADYVVKHFGDEEELQVESKYPRYEQHKAIHQEFIRTFQGMYAEFLKNGPSEELSKVLSKGVSNWIITHIKMEDVTFGKHYAEVKMDRLKTRLSN